MPDSPPRLDTAQVGQTAYAPVSWTAVASLAVSGFFVISLLILGAVAFLNKQPLIHQWLFLFPVVGVVLAFAARRQILNSEGTRTGLSLATAGWWLGVIGGLGYGSYLFGIDFVVRNDAQREFVSWTNLIREVDPNNPNDPKIYHVIYRSVPPQSRAQVKGPDDIATAEKVFRNEMAGLRQLDMFRIATRNRDNLEFTGFGVRDWQQPSPDRLVCTLTCKMITPEGEHGLAVPMQAQVTPSGRQWHFGTHGGGMVQSRSLTRYGWLLEQVEAYGRDFAHKFFSTIRNPGQQRFAYDLFVRGMTDRPTLVDGAAVGILPLVIWDIEDNKVYESALAGGLCSRPNGGEMSSEERTRFLHSWNQGTFFPAGLVLKDNPDVNPILRVTETGVELRVPFEIGLGTGMGRLPNEAARGKLILRADDPQLAKELKEAKDQGGPRSPEPPKELLSRPIYWRIERIESDLRPMTAASPSEER